MLTKHFIFGIVIVATTVLIMTSAQTNVMAFNDKNDVVVNEHEHQNCSNNGGSLDCHHTVAGDTVNTNDPGVIGGDTHINTNCNNQRHGDDCKTNSH